MNLITEISLNPSHLKRELEAARKREAKEEIRREELRQREEDRKESAKRRKQKGKRLKWQMERSKIKHALRREQEKKALAKKKGELTIPKSEVISSKDTDATATRKGISNLFSVGGALARLGVNALAARMKKKQVDKKDGEEKFKKMITDIKNAKKQSQRLLPPASSSEFEKTDKTRIERPGSSRPVPQMSRPFTVSQRVRMSRRVLPPRTNRPSSGFLATTSKIGPNSSASASSSRPESEGQKARKNIKYRRSLIQQRGTNLPEQFSCWREEFLYELGDLRQRVKNKKKPIDIMGRGKNKVSINPNVTEKYHYDYLNETTNTSSIFAKATPPMKKRTTPLSDVYLSKQPGKGNAEMVQKKMRRLFLGDRSNFTSNYDLSGHKSDDSEFLVGRNYLNISTNEAYDDGDETFRQHSHEEITSTPGGSTRKKSTSAVLRAMAAMNKDVVPPKKKKKKKKKDTQEQ